MGALSKISKAAATVTVLALASVAAAVLHAATADAASCTTQTSYKNGFVWNKSSPPTFTTADGWCLTRPDFAETLRFESNGNLVLQLGSKTVWTSATSGRGSQFETQASGVFGVWGCTGQGGAGCNPPSRLWYNSGANYYSPLDTTKYMIQLGQTVDGEPCITEANYFKHDGSGVYGWDESAMWEFSKSGDRCFYTWYATN